MRKMVLTEQDFEQVANNTALSAYAYYEVPAGLYMEFDMTSRFVFKPVIVETITVATAAVNTTTSELTITLTHPCAVDDPVAENAIVAFDTNQETYLTLTSYDPSTKTAVFSWTTNPTGHVVDVYYPAFNHFDKLAIAVPVGTGEDVFPIKSYDQGKLAILDQKSIKQALYLPKPAAMIEDFRLQLMTRDTVRHAVKNIRNGDTLPNAKLEIPVVVGSISEAYSYIGGNLKQKIITMLRNL